MKIVQLPVYILSCIPVSEPVFCRLVAEINRNIPSSFDEITFLKKETAALREAVWRRELLPKVAKLVESESDDRIFLSLA